ncbi:MAG: cytochrome c family protein [bacterium]|nr:cytochrome c family protein [bacterium]
MKKSILFTVVLLLLSASMLAIGSQPVKHPDPKSTATVGEKQVEKKDSVSILYDWQNRIRPIPDEHVFQTKYLGGTQIVFNHKKHVDSYKLECINCHHVESCKHCHSKEVKTMDISESKVALHENCFACHRNMSCVECHKK